MKTHKAAEPTISSPPLPQSRTFYQYLFKDKTNRVLLGISLLAGFILFAVLKSWFPMPDYFGDSNSYVLAAKQKMEMFYRPMGYAHFLTFLHDLNPTQNFVVYVHYTMLLMTSLFFYFSLDYLFVFSSKPIKYLSWLLIIVNPLILVAANQIGSDSLFTALTLFWFTSLLWIIRKPNWWMLVLQVLLLNWAFHVRYNALYYPAVTLVVFLIAKTDKKLYKIAGIAASFLVIYYSYSQIRQTTERITGARVFAGFSGWQMANNALYMYNHINVETSDFDDAELQKLDFFVKHCYDSINVEEKEAISKGKLPPTFLWDPKGPLKQFLFYKIQTTQIPYFASWHQVSELYGTYAKQLILQHPGAYFKYYIWNNLMYYGCPDPEFLSSYNADNITLPESTLQWFNLKNDKPHANRPGMQKSIVAPYRYIHLLLVIFSFVLPVAYLYKKKKESPAGGMQDAFRTVGFWLCYMLTNMGFAILASIITLRYELPFFVLAFGLPLWFLDQILKRKTS